MNSDSKIRVALVGLSTSAKTSWAEQAHLPYLQSPRGVARYTVVALLNSSAAAAEAARAHFQLPQTVKAYGSPDELAADTAVDLVVVCTRVDTHYDAVLPSLKAGKTAFVEWPLAESTRAAGDLLAAMRRYGAPASIIGLQARMSPVVRQVAQLLADGAVGKVLSSDVHAFGNGPRRDAFTEGVAYFADRKIGGNPPTIAFGHMVDFVHHVLGEFGWFNATLQIQRPKLGILRDGEKVREVVSDVPDLISLAGPLVGKDEMVMKDATLTVTYRTGPSFPGAPGFVWTINGENGEIRVNAPGPYLQSDLYDGQIDIEVHDFQSDKVQKIDWDCEPWQNELPRRARNVALLYERYADWALNARLQGKDSKDLQRHEAWPQFEDAVDRHQELQEMFDKWDAVNGV